jgi:predicted porin
VHCREAKEIEMKGLLVVGLVLSLGGEAMAGGVGAPETKAAVTAVAGAEPATDWTGFYLGVSVASGRFSDDGGATSDGTEAIGVQAGYLRDLGTVMIGGELAYAKGNYDAFADLDWTSTRLKLIGGYDAGRLLPYGFVGISRYEIRPVNPNSDNVAIFGIGAKYAATPKVSVGLEYLVEDKRNYDNDFDLENRELSLRVDYRF